MIRSKIDSRPGRGAFRLPARLTAAALALSCIFFAGGCAALVVGGAGNPGSYPGTSRSEARKAADERISGQIRAVFRADSYLQSAPPLVSTQDGQVTLTGTVTSYAARSQAETLAAGVQGVVGVHNKLRVTNGY